MTETFKSRALMDVDVDRDIFGGEVGGLSKAPAEHEKQPRPSKHVKQQRT